MTASQEHAARAIPDDTALENGSPHAAADTASPAETVRVAATVLAPTIAKGLIKRRPAVMQLAERWQLDRRAVTVLRRIRRRHHGRPVRLRIPGRSVTVLLDHTDVGKLLAGTPSPFSPASWEKRAALSHFQPHGVLITEGGLRQRRRRINERALEPGNALHHLADTWTRSIDAGARDLPATIRWDDFADVWWRIVRELTLGGDTVDDRELTDLLGELRQGANWAYLLPALRRRRDRFLQLVRTQVGLERPGSLAAALNAASDDAAGQVPHWLFAFDAAGIATFRALALVATHPQAYERARAEAAEAEPGTAQQLPFLRACVLEALRLWPTTPALLREARTDTEWGRDGATFLVFAPLLHRDSARMPWADRFEPDSWLDGRAQRQPALVPFSGGPAACPGRDVVLLTTATLLAAILRRRDVRLSDAGGARLGPGRLPATLNHFALTFSG